LLFRAIERSVRRGCAVLGLACLAAGVVVGCDKTIAGTTGPTPSFDPAEPVPGIATTQPEHLPPAAVTCARPPATGAGQTTAKVSDPVAPTLAVSLPDGWSSVGGAGDRALTLTGPDGMSGAVIIAATDLEPGGAFLKYAVDMRDSRPGVRFTVAAAQFCGYSGQQLTGTFQNPSGAFDFADRLAHIWTNSKKYLVAIQLRAPAGTARFDAAKSTLMQEFGVTVP
jgi:hypothetical protein